VIERCGGWCDDIGGINFMVRKRRNCSLRPREKALPMPSQSEIYAKAGASTLLRRFLHFRDISSSSSAQAGGGLDMVPRSPCACRAGEDASRTVRILAIKPTGA